jgi:predicted  nucleic acid-binding Zn-ribbon protein
MSVLSTLALLVTTAAVKSKPKKADRVAALEAEIAGLKGDLADVRRDLDQALSQHDALRDELERRLLRHGEHRRNQAALQQYAALQNAQAQVYGQGLAQQQGLLGAQALGEMWCNCVPSRAQVWAARNDGC